jgi:hypothetical protein
MNLTLMKIATPRRKSPDEWLMQLSQGLYDSTTGVGFRDLDMEPDGQISGYSVKRRPILVRVFDIGENRVIEREELLLTECFFRLDMNLALVEIHKGPRDARFCVDVFSEALKDPVHLENTSETVSSILSAMRTADDPYEISRLEVTDFVAESGVIGKYAIRSIDAVKSWKFVEKYGNQIKGASVTLANGSLQAFIQIQGAGRFRLTTRPKSSTQEVAKVLKELVVGLIGAK